ncbi:hypothetical protein [Terrabacter sp. 2RAF25]|uniref:hypothetical protein n=1 Tax=Terrabacter sp. 2RAF25 TaxID=3232998 RepID=UPI003F97B5AF
MLRRAAPLLLLAGAVLLAAVLVWPTQHLVSRTAGGSEPVIDIWFGGRARGVSESVSANGDSSPGLVALVAAGMVLMLAAGVVWAAAVARRRSGVRWVAVAAAALAAVTTIVLSTAFAFSGSTSFGWTSTVELGVLEFERTPVALFLPAAAVLAVLAVVAMLVVLSRRRAST